MKRILIILVVFMIYSCSNTSDSKISRKLQNTCAEQGSNCIISLNEIITEDWDYVLISTESFSLEDLNNQLGFEYPYFTDIGKRIIFVKGNKVVYYEDEFPDPEQIKKGEVYFDMGNNNFMKIERDKAIFKVVKENNYYILTNNKATQ